MTYNKLIKKFEIIGYNSIKTFKKAVKKNRVTTLITNVSAQMSESSN